MVDLHSFDLLAQFGWRLVAVRRNSLSPKKDQRRQNGRMQTIVRQPPGETHSRVGDPFNPCPKCLSGPPCGRRDAKRAELRIIR